MNTHFLFILSFIAEEQLETEIEKDEEKERDS